MAERTIVYWRDIPAEVIVRRGRRRAAASLPERFHEAIDRAAMRSGARDSDAYLEAWRRSHAETCGDDLEEEAASAARALEAAFPDERLNALVANGGFADD